MTVPNSETKSWDAITTSTLEADNGKVYDNIVKGIGFLAYMTEADKIVELDGGLRIKVDLMYGKNTTVKAKTDYGLLDTTPQDGITAAFAEWREIAGTLVISRAERRKNSGKTQQFDLIQAKEQQLVLSTKQEFIRQLLGAGGTNADGASELDGFQVAMDDDANNSYMGIDRATYTWWCNQYGTIGSFAAQGLAKVRLLYRSCSKGNVTGAPDLLLCDGTLYDAFEAEHVLHLQFAPTGKANENLFNLGIENFKYKRATVMYEEQMDSSGRIYFINSDHLKLYVDKESKFKILPAVTPSNQTATVAPIITMANLGVNNSRKLGVGVSGTA